MFVFCVQRRQQQQQQNTRRDDRSNKQAITATIAKADVAAAAPVAWKKRHEIQIYRRY